MEKHYYVVCFGENRTTFVSRHDNVDLVCNYIKKEMRNDTTCELDDFQVIYGSSFSLKEKIVKEIYLKKMS